ncbi:MAG TPA: CotH kinase family protein, partial [Prolixibacteraceae bacterium]|nr:CotH kinase family protein [Prolixibacteraceae bacterium]
FQFTVNNTDDIKSMLLDLDFDDGFVAYLNGTEVARENVKGEPAWNMRVTRLREALLYQGGVPERYELTDFLYSDLKTGKNTLAIQVHNESASSSDLSSNAFLHVEVLGNESLYGPVPDWFEGSQVYTEFNLPLMIVNTNKQRIPDEPRIVADMGLIYNGDGKVNKIDDVWNEYSGRISIEIRGESSAGFAKKSYSIELQNLDGSNNNVSLLGLPKENDFVLYGPYSDKTMMKNVLTYELFRRTGRWAPRTRFFELVLNDDYRGIYVLTEKIKRDKNRVVIDKITSDDVTAQEISGGYILRRDKKNDERAEEWWTSPVNQPYHNKMWYQYFDPKYEELNREQAAYIKNWMKEFDQAMSGSSFKSQLIGYRKYINTRSFIDLMFVNEISKGIDNYNFSNYFYKENDNDGGQLVAGPPWDYNLGYGNVNYGSGWDAHETFGWCFTQGGRIYWYERLMEDQNYRDIVSCKWTEYRESIYSDESVLAFIDSCVLELGDAVDRNFTKYKTLGKYIWPAREPVPETFDEEVQDLKDWLIDRLAWMDTQWYGKENCNWQPPSNITLSNNVVSKDFEYGSKVGYLLTTDFDSDVHTYRLVSGEGDADNDKFDIKNNKVVNNTIFNYQFKKNYHIRIESKDENDNTFEKAFEIEVQNTTSSELNKINNTAFRLYPNPTENDVQIIDNGIKSSELQVRIVDLSGKLLFQNSGSLNLINQ